MIGSAGLSGRFAPDSARDLQPLARVAQRVLVRALGQRESLQTDTEARGVHHGEHRLQALVRLPDQPTLRAIEVHHAGRRALDAHLVLDRAAAQRVALADRAVARDLELRGHEQRDALGPGGASGSRASTRCTMLSVKSCSPAVMKILVPVIA